MQSVKYPPTAYLYLQDLLAKKLNNPIVKRHQERFPDFELVEDEETNSIAFKHDECVAFIFNLLLLLLCLN